MPSSDFESKPHIIEWVKKNDPARVLDIGVGEGTYSNYLRSEINAEWVGIEAWKPYVKQFDLKSKYDTLLVEDAREVDYDSLGSFDVCFAGDVLEHMSKEDAIDLVEKLLGCSEVVIASIPIVNFSQDAVNGNPYEVHVKWDWSDPEFKRTWGHYIFKEDVRRIIGVYYLSNTPDKEKEE